MEKNKRTQIYNIDDRLYYIFEFPLNSETASHKFKCQITIQNGLTKPNLKSLFNSSTQNQI